jgi:hypothetical protein
MLVTMNGTQVGCLTDVGDGSVRLRLHPRSRVGDANHDLTLEEPTARDYAELRHLMREADHEIEAKFARPEMPELPDHLDAAAQARIIGEFNVELNAWADKVKDYMRDPETAPYLRAIFETCRRLAKAVEIDDLTAEAFLPTTCRALLEVWEAPLGGPVGRAETPRLIETLEPAVPEASPPDSPEPEPSSPPGTEPASPSDPTPSTG